MEKGLKLTELQLDALREVGNIGAGHAATTLSELIDRKVLITVPQIRLLPFPQLLQAMGGSERAVAAVYNRVSGDISGSMLFVFPQESVFLMLSLLQGREVRVSSVLNDAEKEELRRTGDILAISYLNALTRFTGVGCSPSSGEFAFDMVGAIIDSVAAQIGLEAEYAVLIETEFMEASRRVRGKLLFLPSPRSLKIILERLGIEEK